MSFFEGIRFYFTNILDLTSFVACFIVSAAFCVYCFSSNINKKEIIKLSLLFFISYSTLIILPAFTFGLSQIIHVSMNLKQLLFSFTIPLIVLVFSLLFSKGYRVHRFIKTMILISSIFVTEVLSKNTGIMMGQLANDIFIIVAFSRSLPYIFFLLTCFLLNRIDITRYRNLSNEMIIIITSLSFLLIVIGIIEHAFDIHEVIVNTLLSILDFVLLLILSFSYYATYKMIENRHRITNLEVQKTLGEAEKMSIAIDQKNREELEKIRHDLRNQFSYLSIFLKQGKIEEASQYIESFLDNQEVLNAFSCSNNVINSIINLELTKAKIKNIKIDVKVVVPPILPFNDSDLVSLLTNMTDNAIENYYSDNDDKIIIRIMKQNDYIRFFISNPLNKDETDKYVITRTRKLGRGHGYGTKIIKNIVATYNGYVDFNIEDNRFICDAVLNLNKKDA